MTSSEQTREQAISNVETEYHEINSKNAWPILYQVRGGTKMKKEMKKERARRERKRSALFRSATVLPLPFPRASGIARF